MSRGFLKAGHLPTLFAAFLYFDSSFMTWVLLGPLGVAIARDLDLDPAQQGLMVAVPVLAGAALRVPLGALADRLGPRAVGIAAQLIVIAGLLVAWAAPVASLDGLLLLGIVLGLAGASFAVALPLASAWYPPEHQGTALGIAGAGNSGTVLAALVAPGLAAAFGWRAVIGLAALPLAATLLVYFLLARNGPRRAGPRQPGAWRALLASRDAWRFMFFYAVTFGGFVGLASSLTIYFNDRYGLGPVAAGQATAAVVFTGSLMRPVGGAIADRIGGRRTLTLLYAVAAAAFAAIGTGPGSMALALPVFLIGMLALGMGNGAVFQLVPQRFGHTIGAATGAIGAAGGFGGFCFAAGLGYARQITGGYGAGFLAFALLATVALLSLGGARRHRRVALGGEAGR